MHNHKISESYCLNILLLAHDLLHTLNETKLKMYASNERLYSLFLNKTVKKLSAHPTENYFFLFSLECLFGNSISKLVLPFSLIFPILSNIYSFPLFYLALISIQLENPKTWTVATERERHLYKQMSQWLQQPFQGKTKMHSSIFKLDTSLPNVTLDSAASCLHHDRTWHVYILKLNLAWNFCQVREQELLI